MEGVTHSPTTDHHTSHTTTHTAHTKSPTVEGEDHHGDHADHYYGISGSPTLFPHQLSAEHAQGFAIANVVITILDIAFEALNVAFINANLATLPLGALTSFGMASKNKALAKTLGGSKNGMLILGAQEALHSSLNKQLEAIQLEVIPHPSLVPPSHIIRP
jgi:hypothetical protein